MEGLRISLQEPARPSGGWGASGIIQELSGQSGATTEGRGEAWRARSTDAPGAMVQGCENRGGSKVWGE